MKKYLFALALVVILLVATASLASANGGPHGGYTATTDACAGCHRAHTAVGPGLLVETSTQALCLSCHGAAGSGADTNVVDGVYVQGRNAVDTTGDPNTANNGNLLGGGFTNYKLAATTSTHLSDGTALLAWGNGVDRGATATLGAGNGLDCASCHDPHGSTNYRILRTTVNALPVVVAQVDEDTAKPCVGPGCLKDYDTEQWGAGQSQLCAACHSSYHRVNAGQGSTLDGTTYTHRVDMQWDAAFAGAANPESAGMGGYTLPLALTNNPAAGDGVVVCQTCHLPHGTSSAMTGFAAGTYDPAGATGPIPSGDSALLRIDNRGVCEVCHQK